MSQACIWGMSAKFFNVFAAILDVTTASNEKCGVCDQIRHMPGQMVSWESIFCPVMVERMTDELLNSPHSLLYTWYNKFAASAPTLEVKEKRWLSCLHGAYYYMPPSRAEETMCDAEIVAVSPRVAEGCDILNGNPWSDESFAWLDWTEAMKRWKSGAPASVLAASAFTEVHRHYSHALSVVRSTFVHRAVCELGTCPLHARCDGYVSNVRRVVPRGLREWSRDGYPQRASAQTVLSVDACM
eukprot:1622042-Prymnesium_polylepis.1